MSPREGTLRRRWYPANKFLNSPERRRGGVLKRLGAALQGLPELRAERFVTAVNQRGRIAHKSFRRLQTTCAHPVAPALPSTRVVFVVVATKGGASLRGRLAAFDQIGKGFAGAH